MYAARCVRRSLPRTVPSRSAFVSSKSFAYSSTANAEAAAQTPTPDSTTTTTTTTASTPPTPQTSKPKSWVLASGFDAKPTEYRKFSAPKPAPKFASKPTPKPTTPAPAATDSTTHKKTPPAAVTQPAVDTSSKPQSWSPRANQHPTEVDWTRSFLGASTVAVTPEQAEILAAPLDPNEIEVKADGIVYLPEIKYRRRLNQAFGPMGWSMIPRSDPVVGPNIVTREYALIVGGRFAAQAQGENNYFDPSGLPSAVEGCKSNALMRCCKDLGVASELWDPQFLRNFKKDHMVEAWGEHSVSGKKKKLWFRKGAIDFVYPYKKG